MPNAAHEFTRLLDIMARLRAPDGCPWDREQTLESLTKYVLEETYEVLDAIERADHDGLREELGDFMLQAVFLAQIEQESGRFDIGDALRAIADKLVRRHPHVFERDNGEAALDTAAQVKTRWEAIKAEERSAKGAAVHHSALHGIPNTLPALLRAHHMGARASSAGFDFVRAEDVVPKVREELAEVEEVLSHTPVSRADLEEELGDLLFAAANLARKLKVEPEAALRKASQKFAQRFAALEEEVAREGLSMHNLTPDELDVRWRRAKVDVDASARIGRP